MKILFVNNFRYRGGGEEFLMELLPGLISKGVHIGLVCRPHTPLATMFSGKQVAVYPIEKSGAAGFSSFSRSQGSSGTTGIRLSVSSADTISRNPGSQRSCQAGGPSLFIRSMWLIFCNRVSC